MIIAIIPTLALLLTSCNSNSDQNSNTNQVHVTNPSRIIGKIAFESFVDGIEVKVELDTTSVAKAMETITRCSYREETPACDFIPNFSFIDVNGKQWQIRSIECDDKLSINVHRVWELYSNGTICSFTESGNRALDSIVDAVAHMQMKIQR